MSDNVPLITATTASVALEQSEEDPAPVDTDGNETGWICTA